MKRLSQLLLLLDEDSSTNHKVESLAEYFRVCPERDAVWALYLLTGRKLKRLIKRKQIFDLIEKASQIPPWLIDECYAVVGDLAETCALLLRKEGSDKGQIKGLEDSRDIPLHVWMEKRCAELPQMEESALGEALMKWWGPLSRHELFLAIKLLTGGFRSGVAQGLVVKALAKAFDKSPSFLLEGLSGEWPVTEEWYRDLIRGDLVTHQHLSPLPFYLASPLTGHPETLGNPEDFCIEWKWDGIRAQILKREGRIAIWSRGEELITDRFPELVTAVEKISGDFILDGEIVAFQDGSVLPFGELQKRIGRKKITAQMQKNIPAHFFAFDCLGIAQRDLRTEALQERRTQLESLVSNVEKITISPHLLCKTWKDAEEKRAEAKSRGVEGLMLKKWDSVYRMGRKKGDFWKWKIDPMTLDGVLIYAQAGHGRRATLYTDYTFALWKKGELVPFAKAYSGLDDSAIKELDSWIRKHTKERFGPVRSVEPLRVFEIAFEGISLSKRHKSGIAVRFPRILRERTDKKPDEADSVERALELMG